MSRRTRRGAKVDITDESLLETSLKISKEMSPPASQRSTRARRHLSKTILQDSEMDDSLEVNKSRRKNVEETPSRKSTRSRKNATIENVIDNSLSVLEVASDTKKRSRRIKNNNVLSELAILADSSIMNESAMEQSRVTRSRKKILINDNSEMESDATEVTSTKKKKRGNAKNSTANDIENPMSKKDEEILQVSIRLPRLRVSPASSPRSVFKRRTRNTRTKIENITPESSPITINLTPHRSTKTPRKSPMNLSSPKTHTAESLGATITPRKLPVVGASPTESEISLSSDDTPKKMQRPARKTNASSGRKKKFESEKKSPMKSPVLVRKFSKSPKIVLRTPKSATSKGKSFRISSSKKKSPILKRLSKSPLKLRQSQSPTITKKNTPSPQKESAQSPKIATSVDNKKAMNMRVNIRNSTTSNDAASPQNVWNTTAAGRSPTVVLNKILSPLVAKSRVTTRSSPSRRSNALANESPKITPVATPSADKRASQGGESPRRVKSAAKKRTPIMDADTPLRPSAGSICVDSSKASIDNSVIISFGKNTPMEKSSGKRQSKGNVRMVSSTPRERIRRSLNLSSPILEGTTSPRVRSPAIEPSVGSSMPVAEVRIMQSSLIVNGTSPLVSEDNKSFPLKNANENVTHSDETFEIVKMNMANVEEEERAEIAEAIDGTYELDEPKTPLLRSKSIKRSLAEIDTSVDERITKRVCRVRFASPNIENKKLTVSDIGKLRSATPRSHGVATAITMKNHRKRSNSISNLSTTETPIANIKRRSNSMSEINRLSAKKMAQNAFVSRLSKPKIYIQHSNKKPEIKTPIPKRAPNFTQIHEKKFAKLESIVDAKKRVEKRHLAFNTQIPASLTKVNTAARTKAKVSPKSHSPNVPANGNFNRFGFKIRKNEAMKVVSQKQPSHTSEKKQNENRQIIKGVRSNRRFDLIMKARNIH